MALKTLLQDLAERRDNFVHIKRKAPYVGLLRKGRDMHSQTVQLLDVGSDFITIGVGSKNELVVARDQIAEVLWIGEGN